MTTIHPQEDRAEAADKWDAQRKQWDIPADMEPVANVPGVVTAWAKRDKPPGMGA